MSSRIQIEEEEIHTWISFYFTGTKNNRVGYPLIIENLQDIAPRADVSSLNSKNVCGLPLNWIRI